MYVQVQTQVLEYVYRNPDTDTVLELCLNCGIHIQTHMLKLYITNTGGGR